MRTMPKPVRAGQQGVVLIVVLIMLVIIGLTSASVMRNALTADLVSNNVRAEALATEAAQIALAFCEAQIQSPTGTVTIRDIVATGPHWQNLANWDATTPPAAPATLTADQLKSTDGAIRTNHLPQCMAERQALGTGPDTVVVVTSRGFSPDYSEDTNHRAVSGSVVWLQSTLRMR